MKLYAMNGKQRQRVRTRNGTLIIVARNNDRPLVFREARRDARVAGK